jgi:hypothetical protein
MNWRIGISALLAFATTMFSTGLAQAVEVKHSTDYSISLAGLPIARASFYTEFNADRYTISGTMNSAGLADLGSDLRLRHRRSGSAECFGISGPLPDG